MAPGVLPCALRVLLRLGIEDLGFFKMREALCSQQLTESTYGKLEQQFLCDGFILRNLTAPSDTEEIRETEIKLRHKPLCF